MLPAESVTPDVLAPLPDHVMTSTTRRSPTVRLADGVTPRLVLLEECALTCCTNAGADAVGVTALDGEEAGPVPMALVADTVKV